MGLIVLTLWAAFLAHALLTCAGLASKHAAFVNPLVIRSFFSIRIFKDRVFYGPVVIVKLEILLLCHFVCGDIVSWFIPSYCFRFKTLTIVSF